MDLSDPDLKVLTADMEVLRDPEQIFHAAQAGDPAPSRCL
jgi:hypothetical protein